MFFPPPLIEKAMAQVVAIKPAPVSGTVDSNSAEKVITSFGNSVFDLILLVGGILAVLYVMWAGVQYITAGGSAEKTKAARAGIINGVIGVIIIMAAFFIINIAVSIGNSINEKAVQPAPKK